MLGQRVLAEARSRGHDASATDRADLDLTDRNAVAERIAQLGPEAIVNCAAYTDVDRAESEEVVATLVNGDAAGHLAEAAARAGAFLVHVSTDYVFAGDA